MTMAALGPYCTCCTRPAGGQRHKQRQKPPVRPTGYGSATTSAPSPIRSTPASCTNGEIAALPAALMISVVRARVIATKNSRRSSWILLASSGKRPSSAPSNHTSSHSRPLAPWAVSSTTGLPCGFLSLSGCADMSLVRCTRAHLRCAIDSAIIAGPAHRLGKHLAHGLQRRSAALVIRVLDEQPQQLVQHIGHGAGRQQLAPFLPSPLHLGISLPGIRRQLHTSEGDLRFRLEQIGPMRRMQRIELILAHTAPGQQHIPIASIHAQQRRQGCQEHRHLVGFEHRATLAARVRHAVLEALDLHFIEALVLVRARQHTHAAPCGQGLSGPLAAHLGLGRGAFLTAPPPPPPPPPFPPPPPLPP